MTRKALVLMLLVAACASGHDVVTEGRRTILGMTAETFQACAGIPKRTKQLDPRTEILSYEPKNENTGGVEMNAPIRWRRVQDRA